MARGGVESGGGFFACRASGCFANMSRSASAAYSRAPPSFARARRSLRRQCAGRSACYGRGFARFGVIVRLQGGLGRAQGRLGPQVDLYRVLGNLALGRSGGALALASSAGVYALREAVGVTAHGNLDKIRRA